MEYLKPGKEFKWVHAAVIFTETGPVTIPYEPKVKPSPEPVTIPRPSETDPFNVPAPKVNPTPKGFSFFSFD